uniref:Proteasome activator subunit 1 n=1 Tax=Chrysemys picta bellii TaxID=8478 RepID=A0A8C3IQN5_CHRPI
MGAAARTPGFPAVRERGCPDTRVLHCAGEGVPRHQGSPLCVGGGRPDARVLHCAGEVWGCPDARVLHCVGGGTRTPGFPTAQEGDCPEAWVPSRGSGTPGMVGETLGPSFPWFCPPQGDYRQLVHELDEAQYAEIRLMVMEIRNLYAILYDIVVKNFEKIKKPRGETKGMIY